MYNVSYLGAHPNKIFGIRWTLGVLQVAPPDRGQERQVG
jgi:hypothetical protein